MTAKQTPEIIDLLRRINEGATSSSASLSEVLRLCMRLGRLLNNQELEDWAKSEAGGYDEAASVPDYRIFDTNVRGTFFGPMGSGYKNAHIPQAVIEKEHRDNLFKVYMKQPVGELEQYATKETEGDGGNSLTISWPADAIMYYQQKTIYEGLVLGSAWQTMTTTVIAGVLEIIRTRILEFVLAIEQELGVSIADYDSSRDKAPLEAPGSEKVRQIFYTTIQQGGNIALGNSGTTNQQSINVQPGNLESLKQSLAKLGLTPEIITELEDALSKDADADEQPGPATRSWLARVMIKIGKGAFKVVSTTAGSVITAEVRKYLGLSPT